MNDILTFVDKKSVVHAYEMMHSCAKRSSRLSMHLVVDCTQKQAQSLQQMLDSVPMSNGSTFYVYAFDPINKISRKFIDHCLSLGGTFQKMAYARCFTPSILSIDKALYMDFDIIATKSIDSLLGANIDDFYSAQCYDISIMAFNKQEMQKLQTNVYFNTGVAFFNLKKMREDGIDKKLEDFIFNPPNDFFGEGYEYGEQSILNRVLKGKIKPLDPRFNVQAILLGFPIYNQFAQQVGYRDEKDMIDNCVLAHCQGAKPWNADWNTWQAWQVPLKKFMEDAYLSNKKEIESKGIYNMIANWEMEACK